MDVHEGHTSTMTTDTVLRIGSFLLCSMGVNCVCPNGVVAARNKSKNRSIRAYIRVRLDEVREKMRDFAKLTIRLRLSSKIRLESVQEPFRFDANYVTRRFNVSS